MTTQTGAREPLEQSVRHTIARGGQPLEAGVRRAMEARFGTDFSAVRVHADSAAAASARLLGTSAYTVGQHLVFGAGRYRPSSTDGRSLLAHELTHSVQQRDRTDFSRVRTPLRRGHPAEREAAGVAARPGRAPAIIHGTGTDVARDEGTAEIVDTVTGFQSTPTEYSATMHREQFRTHAEAEAARKGTVPKPPVMDTGDVRVVLDTAVPEIRLPVRVSARAAVASDYGTNSKPTTIKKGPISQARVTEVSGEFVRTLNTRLNGWFSLDVPACQGVAWSGRTLPIRVVVSQVSSGPVDYTVAVSPHKGRSFVWPGGRLVLLFAEDLDQGTLAHEGTHMVLGHPDEYAESDPALRQVAPLQKGEQRVHTDFTLAGDHFAWGRWVQLHERHFSFVPVFVQDVLTRLGHPDCHPSLKQLDRPTQTIVSPSFGVGGSSYGGGAMYLTAGIDVGWNLDRRRSWRAFLGAHGELLLGSDYRANTAFLLGARLGFEHRWNPGGFGPGLQLFGEGGGTGETHSSSYTEPRRLAPYAGAGARLDVGAWTQGTFIHGGIEAFSGWRLDAEHLHFAQLGFNLAVDF
jgi:hypothetical protein